MSLQDLKADTWRLNGDFRWRHLLTGALTNRNFRVLVTMRLCQSCAASGPPGRLVLPLLKVLHRLATSGAAMDLPWRVTAGGGLTINHGWGLVVNQGVVIGRNVTLFHGVTLGRRDRIARDGSRQTGFPVIEDEVWIGPNAMIVGDVTIGRGSRVAGGAFVTQSVPPFSIVSGNPAAIVKLGCVPDVLHPAPV